MSTKPTAQDILKKVEAVKPKIASLTSSATSFQGANVEQGLAVHNAVLLLKQAMDDLTPNVVNVQRPVPLADATQIIKAWKEIQISCNTTANELITKKGLYDSLAVANLTAIIKQDLKEIHAAFVPLADAFIDVAPSEVVELAKSTRKEYDEIIKKALVVYQ